MKNRMIFKDFKYDAINPQTDSTFRHLFVQFTSTEMHWGMSCSLNAVEKNFFYFMLTCHRNAASANQQLQMPDLHYDRLRIGVHYNNYKLAAKI